MKEYVIIMADIIGSRKTDQAALMTAFKQLVKDANFDKQRFKSPLTITLGDEFQGILSTIADATAVVLDLEEALIRGNHSFKLRYVIVEGLIDTPLNNEIAYGMMGDGLTRARKYLETLKKDDSRFFFWLKNSEKKIAINNAFIALQEIIDDWRLEKDYYLVTAFLKFKSYIEVANALAKERSLMWKRKKSLKINTYLALKEVANYIANA